LSGPEKKNEKQKTESGKPEIGPDRFSFSVSCFPFPVFCFLPVWFRLVRVRILRLASARAKFLRHLEMIKEGATG
jgi:hypothetical protein